MAIRDKKELEGKKQIIDLSGPDGNAFVLLGKGKGLCKALGKDFGPISKEMMSGDYENLLKVFDREFGSYFTLYR